MTSVLVLSPTLPQKHQRLERRDLNGGPFDGLNCSGKLRHIRSGPGYFGFFINT